ncbi:MULTISPECIES: ligand-binding sensor domain-containing diguanylate cyclase [Hydrocarboniphaga]|uniref:diguanylate cyclase n=1 Tax=Hydrocarboniphaga effusa AP103 TaxID=1172194 RepID=I8T1Y9_9GAMM|nr:MULTISPECIES: ligand-binding sensor domain-containing diguanylate cyclase [Hydrocarboniphaga]EIT67930.1 hypothetical protein WQQ_43650 [Hydrocarboniphaga effusa AP103]MDZ4077008.1 diguanylate cyclase [Hydrocarboniphaga sp.]
MLASCLGLLVSLTALPQSMAADAQASPAPMPAPYLFETYGRAQGLANPNVFSLLQDREGFLWVGTQRGLYRFEGTRFRHFADAQGRSEQGGDGNLMGALLQDRAGRIWVGTQSGLYVVEGDGLAAVNGEDGRPLSLNATTSTLAESPDGRLLVVAVSKLLQVHSGPGGWRAEAYAPDDPAHRLETGTQIRSVGTDADGTVWIGCAAQLCELAEGSLRVWDESAGVPNTEWYRYAVDGDGTFWAMSLEHIIALPKGATRFEDRTPGVPMLAGAHIFVLAPDAQGRMRTSLGSGIAVWRDGKWNEQTASDGLPEPPVIAMLAAADDSSWYGVAGSGLLRRLGDDRWRHLRPADGLQNGMVWSMADDLLGRTWIATHLGVDLYDPRAGQGERALAPWAEGARLGVGSVQYVRRDRQGRMWLAGNDGQILVHDPRSGATQRGKVTDSINDLLVDAADRVWIATYEGVSRVSMGDGELRIERVHAKDRGYRQLMSDGRSVVAVADRELLRVGEQGASRLPYAPAQEAPAFGYGDMTRDGALWLVDSARGGLVRLSDIQSTKPEFIAFPALAKDTAAFLSSDRQDRIWIGTDSGVIVYDHGRWHRLAHGDGLVWDDCDSGAFYVGDDGSITIGTSNGLTRLYDVGPLLAELKAPRASIIEKHWNGGPITIDRDGRGLATSGRRNELTMQFAAWPLGSARQMLFRYRLLGVDEDWIESQHADVRYPKLPWGDYRFELQAFDPQRQLSSETVEFDFSVPPSWWQRRPVIALLLLLVAGSIAIAMRALMNWRERRLIAQHQHLEKIVEERTRELERDKQALIEAREDLRILAARDGLTGLLNRTAIFNRLQSELDAGARNGRRTAAVLIDIDHFKSINDNHGHPVGDEVLREVAARLAGAVRSDDGVGRYGGEEFLVVLSNFGSGADERIKRLMNALRSRPITFSGGSLSITSSAGVAWAEGEGVDIAALINRADQALYAAKRGGRDRVEMAESGETGNERRET